MASLIVNRGLARIAAQSTQATTGAAGYSATRHIQTMAWDDSIIPFAAADLALNTGGAVTNEVDQAFTSLPTISGQTVTMTSSLATGVGNFLIRRISVHDDTAANMTTSSATLVSGIDGQSLQKTSDYVLGTTVNHLHSSV